MVNGALIANLTYRGEFPMCVRFMLCPLIGKMCCGVPGALVEVISILCAVFDVCTSWGLGATPIDKVWFAWTEVQIGVRTLWVAR